MKSSNKGKDFCVFALPGLFCFLAVVMVPFIYGIYLTLTDWNGVSSVKNFVGLSNFAAVMRDAQFWKSLLLTFKYVIAVVVLVNVIAFLLAYILTRGIKGQNFFRAGFFTPNLIGSSYSPVFSSASVRPQDGACLKFPGFLPRTKHLQRWCSFQYGSWQAI